MEWDDLDRRLLGELARDGTLSHRELARRLASTAPTVAARLERLRDAGLLGPIQAHLSVDATPATYWLMMRASPAQAKDLQNRMDGVSWAKESHRLPSGLLVRASGTDLDRMARWMAQTAPDAKLDAHVVLESKRHAPDTVETLAVPCHTCGKRVEKDVVMRVLGDRRHFFCCTSCEADMVAKYAKRAALPVVKAKS